MIFLWLVMVAGCLIYVNTVHAQLTGINGNGPNWHPKKHIKTSRSVATLDTIGFLSTEQIEFDTVPILILCSDTTSVTFDKFSWARDEHAYWVHGYQVRSWPKGYKSYMIGDVCILDEKKKPFRYLIWATH